MTRQPLPGFSVRLPPPLMEALRAAADAEGKTVADAIREAVQEWLRVRGRWPPKVGG